MVNNDILRSLRYVLNINDQGMADIFRLGGYDAGPRETAALLSGEESDAFIPCSEKIMGCFLNGLIVYKRGPKEDSSGAGALKERLNNNIILKKLRIAFDLKEENMLEVFNLAGFPVSRPELTALFRREGHRNYKACQDQLLRNFLKGLTVFVKNPGTEKH